MKITVKDESGAKVLHLDGRLDLDSGRTLKKEIKKLCDDGVKRIHLNLQKIEFINSSGLGALVSVMKQVRIKEGRLTLSNLASYVREIFDVTQLAHVFEIFENQVDALTPKESAPAH